MTDDRQTIKARLKEQTIGTPTWGYADSGTRFHVLRRPSAPRNVEERLEDAAVVQRVTGVCPCVDLHTAWDRSDDWGKVRRYAADLGLRIGAVNPHLFDDDDYALGSLCNPSQRVRQKSLAKLLEGVEIAREVGASVLSLWFDPPLPGRGGRGTGPPARGPHRAVRLRGRLYLGERPATLVRLLDHAG